jgi:hypothetical protein
MDKRAQNKFKMPARGARKTDRPQKTYLKKIFAPG